MYKVKHIEDKGFKKLIEKDIRIYFSNEIKKANNPKKLIELYKRIVDIRTQLDPKTYKKIRLFSNFRLLNYPLLKKLVIASIDHEYRPNFRSHQ